MYAVSVGYPIGVKEDKYIIETKQGRKALTFKQAAVWMNFNGVKEITSINEDKTSFDALVKNDLIIADESLKALLVKTYSYCPMRQGVGSLNDGKEAVFLGESVYYPSSEVRSVWELANGARSIEKIYNYCANEFGTEEEGFMRILDSLNEKDLLFLV